MRMLMLTGGLLTLAGCAGFGMPDPTLRKPGSILTLANTTRRCKPYKSMPHRLSTNVISKCSPAAMS